jgi:hypothetical protein
MRFQLTVARGNDERGRVHQMVVVSLWSFARLDMGRTSKCSLLPQIMTTFVNRKED